MANIKSGKVKKTPSTEVSPDRYEFLGLSEAEPDLGVPAENGYILTSSDEGVRSWSELKISYIHDQQTVSDSWFIQHNLDFYPNIVVKDSAGSTVEGDIEYIDHNSLRVTFSSAFSGMAYLS